MPVLKKILLPQLSSSLRIVAKELAPVQGQFDGRRIMDISALTAEAAGGPGNGFQTT